MATEYARFPLEPAGASAGREPSNVSAPPATAAWLDGTPLTRSVSWPLTQGTNPAEAVLYVAREDLARLLSGARRNSSTLNLPSGPIDKLSILGAAPGPNPFVAAVRVADRRYWWRYEHVRFPVNIRRRVGTKRRGDQWNEVLQVGVTALEQYRPLSLNQGQPWKPRDLLRAILDIVDPNASIVVTYEGLEVPIESLDLDLDGESAIRRVLSALPAAALTVDPDGGVRVYDWTDGLERGIVGTGFGDGALGAEAVAGSHVEIISHELTRPVSVTLLATIESEVRFDALETNEKPPQQSSTGSVENGAQRFPIVDRLLENVLPSPDFTLALALAGDPARTVTQGTYISFREALATWRGLPSGSLYDAITEERIRRAFVPGRSMWAAINSAGIKDPDQARANWAGRLSAIQAHYRQTYRLPAEWVDRIWDIKPYLVATIDPTTGQRAPARVWADHCLVLSEKGLAKAINDTGSMPWVINVPGYLGRATDPTDAIQPAPAQVQVLDADQGIVRTQYLTEPFGGVAVVLPSLMADSPAFDSSVRSRQALAPDAIVGVNGEPARLAADQKMAMLITLVPALALYPVTVTAASLGIEAKGPPMFYRLPTAVETARVAWSQAASEAIESCFGLRGAFDAGALRPHVINDAPQEKLALQAASLPALALAAAKMIYAAESDRVEGGMTADQAVSARLAGSLASLTHIVRADGAAQTSATLRSSFPVLDLLSYLDAGTRRIVQRRLQ